MDMIGETFERWTALERIPGLNKSRQIVFRCICQCGKEGRVTGMALRTGASKSCGCLAKEMSSARASTHGLNKHPLYGVWSLMMHRCYNPKNSAFPNYGARGIKVCERWHDVSNFIADVTPTYIEGLTLDRKENDGDYCPDNTRWATRKQQASNRRSNVLFAHGGVTKTIFQWAEHFNIPPRTFWARLKRGWSFEKASSTPV